MFAPAAVDEEETDELEADVVDTGTGDDDGGTEEELDGDDEVEDEAESDEAEDDEGTAIIGEVAAGLEAELTEDDEIESTMETVDGEIIFDPNPFEIRSLDDDWCPLFPYMLFIWIPDEPRMLLLE